MKLSRREMLLASLSLVVTGCTAAGTQLGTRPRPNWTPAPTARRGVSESVHALPARGAAPAVAMPVVAALSRSQWTQAAPLASRVNPLAGVDRMTIHHEGWDPIWTSDKRDTAERIERIRRAHVNDRGWGDIGYHYIIDRAGRVWECRNIRYQGAHVSNNNEHNVGIMCLGNFDRQSPSDAQLQALGTTIRSLQQAYGVRTGRVYTHQELSPSACPGKNLQPRVNAMRNGGVLL